MPLQRCLARIATAYIEVSDDVNAKIWIKKVNLDLHEANIVQDHINLAKAYLALREPAEVARQLTLAETFTSNSLSNIGDMHALEELWRAIGRKDQADRVQGRLKASGPHF